MPKGEEAAYVKLRKARSDARYVGVREKRRRRRLTRRSRRRSKFREWSERSCGHEMCLKDQSSHEDKHISCFDGFSPELHEKWVRCA